MAGDWDSAPHPDDATQWVAPVQVSQVQADVPAAADAGLVAEESAAADAVVADAPADPVEPDLYEGCTQHPGLNADGSMVKIEVTADGAESRLAGSWLPSDVATTPETSATEAE